MLVGVIATSADAATTAAIPMTRQCFMVHLPQSLRERLHACAPCDKPGPRHWASSPEAGCAAAPARPPHHCHRPVHPGDPSGACPRAETVPFPLLSCRAVFTLVPRVPRGHGGGASIRMA